eukprot:jgi/Picsp_1/2819/NSC_01045-R1_cytosolic fe-s cluster assembly factor narfl
MAANFSNTLKITDLNDFIAPSQACVVKDEQKGSVLLNETELGKVAIQRNGGLREDRNEPVKLSLHDCLACSGCVTTAETMLLQQQSIGEFLEKLSDSRVAVVVSLSWQSVVSLAVRYDVEPTAMRQKLVSVLKNKGVHAVFDLEVATSISLTENKVEFLTRLSERENLPMLASSCPGWICYAEKSQDHLLTNISRVKSPQAIMGTLIKHFWSKIVGKTANEIYHATVMPCYDKKLEAVREDFIDDSVPETDCVLATTELLEWLDQIAINVHHTPESPLDQLVSCSSWNLKSSGVPVVQPDSQQCLAPLGSDGYLDYLFRSLASDNGLQIQPGGVSMQPGRNLDIRECSLDYKGRTIKFALVYGFRNIQGLVRKIKMRKCQYEYVEVMACPSGCLNGGGQSNNSHVEGKSSNFEILGKSYVSLMQGSSIDMASNCVEIYHNWIGDDPGSPAAKKFFSTSYHERKTVTPSDW